MSQSIDEVLLDTPARRDGDGEGGVADEGEGDKFVRQLFESLLLGTRASNAIPDGEGQEDYAYNATFPDFRARAEGCGKQVLELIQIFLNHVGQEGELGLPEVGDAGDPEVFEGIAEVVETLLDDVDSYLDDAAGRGANQQVALMRHQLRAVASAARSGPAKYESMVANVRNIPKPQEAFMEEIDNARDTPFVPRLREKPNAVTPLNLAPISDASSMGMGMDSGGDSTLEEDELGFHYPHPYEAEIRAFHYMPGQVQTPDPSQLEKPDPLDGDNPAPAAIFVDTVEALDAMVDDILGNGSRDDGADADADDDSEGYIRGPGTRGASREIAVDLEHHAFRSFQGLVCLMQLSTRERDYILDVIKLRGEMRRLLGVFTDPGIVKVLHGSDLDILWLQRDLGLYVVNMFDTCQAARQLELPSFGLAHLLNVFCDFKADKKHQLSDWRMRPLPIDMLKYAQADTHFLLYVYDRLRVDLERSGGDVAVKSVLDASREICLRRYEKAMFQKRGWAAVLRRQGKGIAEESEEVSQRIISSLWDWRDAIARSEDESPGYVLSINVMLRISRKRPSTREELEGCGNPLPPLVQQEADRILAIVENAKNGIETPSDHTVPLNPRTPSGASTRSSPTTLDAAAAAMSSSTTSRVLPGSGSLGVPGVASSSRTFNPVSSAEPYFRPYNVTPSGASQFVMAEGSRGSPSPLLVQHQSPVLNTEELYRAAGWMTPLPRDDNGIENDDDDGHDGDEGDLEMDGGGGRGSLVSLSSKNEQLDTSHRMGHSLALGGGGSGGGWSAIRGDEGASGRDAGPRTADRIRDEIAREPVLSLRNLDGFGSDPGGAGRGNDGSDGDGEGGGSSSGPGDEESPEEPGIPKSIAEIYEISNRNRRRNKEKKKLRETATEALTNSSPSKTQTSQYQLHPYQQQTGGRVGGGIDSAAGSAIVSDGPITGDAPAANYFSGRKRQKEDAPGQGLGLLADRSRRGPADGRGGVDDTMEFMEDLGWISHEQREALSQHHSPSGGPSNSTGAGGDGSSAPLFDRSLIGTANNIGNPGGGDGLGGGDPQGDGYSRPGMSGARSRGGKTGGPGSLDRGAGGSIRGSGTAGRGGGGGGGRGKGGTPKRDRDAGRGGGIGGARGPAGGVQQSPAFRGYDFGQAPSSMGAYQGQGQREGGVGGNGRGGGRGGTGVFNPFLAPQGVTTGTGSVGSGGRGGGAGIGMGGSVPGGSAQGGYGGGRQQQQQSQHWRPRPDNEKVKSMTYGAQSSQGVGSGRGGGGGNGSRRGR